MNVCLIQFDLAWHKPRQNRAQVEDLLKDVDIAPGTVVILPEMFTTGFTMDSNAVSETMQGDSVTWMKHVSRSAQCDLVGSLVIAEGSSAYNRLVWVRGGKVIDYYDKKHLFAKAGEDGSYHAGERRVVIETPTFRWMPLICYDLRFPVWSRNTEEVEVILYVANWPSVRRSAWRQLLIARAIENQCYVVAVNRIGQDPSGHEYSGDSLVIDPYGEIIEDLGNKQIAQLVTLDGSTIKECRERLPFLRDRDQFEFV